MSSKFNAYMHHTNTLSEVKEKKQTSNNMQLSNAIRDFSRSFQIFLFSVDNNNVKFISMSIFFHILRLQHF